MLPPFIIEQIRQREEKERERRERDQPRLEIPVDRYPGPDRRRPAEPDHDEDDPNRGVIILELV